MHLVTLHTAEHVTVFRKDGNTIFAEADKVPMVAMTAGDVNGDDVIDVLDALAIQTHGGTNERSADINFDGTVDMKDLSFVENNFGIKNPTVSNAPTPKEKYKGNTLESIKKELEGN